MDEFFVQEQGEGLTISLVTDLPLLHLEGRQFLGRPGKLHSGQGIAELILKESPPGRLKSTMED